MSEKIKIMISSTVSDLFNDRKVINDELNKYDFVHTMGITPIKDSTFSSSPHIATIDMAEQCDVFFLILGGKYGMEIFPGLSATETEFDSAYKDDPTKILVLKKENVSVEPKQAIFIEKVTNYFKGYFFAKYETEKELKSITKSSLLDFIKYRAAIGSKLNYFDHFLRIAIQRKPYPDAPVLYSIENDYIELRYEILNKKHIVQFGKRQVLSDFWGCVSELEKKFMEWRK